MPKVTFELKQLSPMSEAEKKRLDSIKDSDIDYSDIPAMPEEFWKNAERGKFYRPVKKPVSLRLDSDVVAWFKSQGTGYQTKINTILRKTMLEQMGKSRI